MNTLREAAEAAFTLLQKRYSGDKEDFVVMVALATALMEPVQEPVAVVDGAIHAAWSAGYVEGEKAVMEQQAITSLRTALEQQQAEPVAQSDLVKRLRETASKGVSVWGNLQMEAAREIEILRAERDCYASAMDKMLAASRAEPVAWQLIETAPKNGSAILVMRDIWPGTKSGRAEECHGHNTYVAAWWDGENNGRGAWVCYTDSVCEPQCPIEPTHWMPLPCPPSIAPSQQQAEPVGEVINERGEVDYISYVPLVGTALYTSPQQQAEQVMLNGLTEAETNTTASVMGLTKQAEPDCEHCYGSGKTIVYGMAESWEENCLYCNGTGITQKANT